MDSIANTFVHIVQKAEYIPSGWLEVFLGLVNAGYVCSIAQHDIEKTLIFIKGNRILQIVPMLLCRY